MQILNKIIFERLKTLRKEVISLPQDWVASICNISQRDISQLESGKKKFIPIEYIQFLNNCSVDINMVFGSDEDFNNYIWKTQTEPYYKELHFLEKLADNLDIIPDEKMRANMRAIVRANREKINTKTNTKTTPNPTISEKAAPVVEYIPVPVNSSGNENIIFVELKSAAGFGAVINNEKALNEYPTIALPGFLYRGRKQYVAFEIDGDSMHPTIQHRDIIIGSRIEGLHDIRNGYVYTLVFNDMIITKRLHYTKGDDYIECLSDNDDVYEPYKQDISEITGIYKGEGIVRTQFRNWNNDVRKNIANLSKRLTTIERYLKKD